MFWGIDGRIGKLDSEGQTHAVLLFLERLPSDTCHMTGHRIITYITYGGLRAQVDREGSDSFSEERGTSE